MAAPQTQYSFRSLKQLGLVSGPPTYEPAASFVKPEIAVRTYKYSADGRYYAYASAAGVKIVDASTAAVVSEIEVKTVIELAFSPKGTQLSTWERHIKPEDGQPPHKNMRVWDTVSGKELSGFSQKAQDGWAMQYTEDESKAVRIVTNEVHVYSPADFGKGIVEKLRLEGVTNFSVSPGTNPNIALFVAEKKGAPASVKVHSLSLLASTSATKTFFKADKIQMKWNPSGTNVLFLTQTEVDKTGKSYYGETNLYMMSSTGIFDCRITLDKEGAIHDFAWSPNDKEFAVTYGYMPAKTVIFDQRVKLVHDFGTQPRNFLSFNPQGRLLCIAGFGNLAGQVDIWDRKTLKKVGTFDAPNTSNCEWSPDGRFLLCATQSPRMRVDNGLRFFHFTGGLMHVESMEELYQASWRPANQALFPFAATLESAPAASISVAASTPVKAAAPAGAYRPPHARGTATPSIFKREDEGGVAYNPSNGVNNFAAHGSGRTSPNFQSRGRRTIPGAAVPDAAEGGEEKSRRKKKGNKDKGGNDSSAGPSGAATPVPPPEPVKVESVADAAAAALKAEALSADDKKRRALMKKLTAIEQLKVKKDNGEKLELTQYKKLETEAEIRKELKALDLGK